MSDVSKLVNLVSFLVSNPGINLRDAAKATHRKPKELVKDLERLLMCGVPPYTPSDFINYRLDGRGDEAVIKINFAQHFARPLNFTPQEVVALKYAMEHFARSADKRSAEEIESLTTALEETLHGRAFELIADKGKGFVTPRRTDRMRDLIGRLSDAVEDHLVMQIEYYSAHRARLATRTVHPYAVIEIGAHFYLFAWCDLAQDTRHFRLDRIRSSKPKSEKFKAPPGRKPNLGKMESLFQGRPKDKLVVRFSKEVARDIADEWDNSPGVELKTLRDGRAELRTPLYNSFWAIGFVMGFGKHAELIEPKWLRRDLSETLQSSLQAHK